MTHAQVRGTTVAILFPFLAHAAQAQAPVITPQGDPTISADTIYRLVVDPAKFPEDAYVYLLDDAVVRLEAGGSGSRTYRQIVQILRQPAVTGLAERRFGWSGDHENFTLNWARVVRPNGEVVSAQPAQMQESDVPASTTNPIYTNSKTLRISLSGLAVGTIIDISYTTEEIKPFHSGDAYTHWNVTSAAAPVVRTRFVFDVPQAVTPLFTERNLDFAHTVTEQNGRKTWSWTRTDVPKYRPEAFAPDTNSFQQFVVASLPVSWNSIASWYANLTADRYMLPAAVQTKVKELLTPARSRLDSIRAIHKWVAQDIRYVSVSLGLGGYQPRTPEQTFTTGFGDCKDKATIFIAALRHVGIDAYPVLLHQSGSLVRKEHPSIRQFNHVIAAVRERSGYTFTDLTAQVTPYGEVPVASQGGFAVIVLPNGRSEEITLPRMGPTDRKIQYKIVAAMSDSGVMSGTFEEINSGPGFEARRAAFYQPLDSARKALIARGLIAILRGASGDSIEAFEGRNLYAPVRYKIWFSAARGTTQTGGLHLFSFPFGVFPGSQRAQAIDRMPTRRSSIKADEVLRALPMTSMEVDMQVTLPEGWKVRLPQSVVVKSDFGTYSTEYSQEGRLFRILRREISAEGIYPPARLDDVKSFFRAIAADENNANIVIDRP